jgi:hypothetical protein
MGYPTATRLAPAHAVLERRGNDAILLMLPPKGPREVSGGGSIRLQLSFLFVFMRAVLCECVLLSAHTILCVCSPFSPLCICAPFSRQVINSSREHEKSHNRRLEAPPLTPPLSREHEDSHNRRREAPASASLQQILPRPLLLPAGKIVTHSLPHALSHACDGGTRERHSVCNIFIPCLHLRR